MSGTIGFWVRIALIAVSGWFASVSGLQVYDPETETITVHVDQISALVASVLSITSWKFLHGVAKKKGGVL
jgi:hypothetical protein